MTEGTHRIHKLRLVTLGETKRGNIRSLLKNVYDKEDERCGKEGYKKYKIEPEVQEVMWKIDS